MILLLALTQGISIKAQGIYEGKMHGPFVALYKLNPAQALFLMNNPYQVDSQWLYRTKVSEMPWDTFERRITLYRGTKNSYISKEADDRLILQQVWKRWDNGYFVALSVNSYNQASYQVLLNPEYRVSCAKVGYEHFVFVTDTAGVLITDAKVSFDTMSCNFDEGIGGYKIRNKDLMGVIHVSRGADFVIKRLYGSRQPKNGGKPPKDKYKYRAPFTTGYLVTNKPRYKFWDTVFWKAYVVNKKSKPLNRELTMVRGQGYKARYSVVKPSEPGVFHGWFIADDSFDAGRNEFQLRYNRKRTHRMVFSSSLYVQDYETEDVNISLLKTSDVSPGFPAKFLLSLSNKAGLPVLDGKIELNLHLSALKYADRDSIAIPLKWYRSKWKMSLTPDPTGITEIILPDSLFIPGEGTWGFTARYTTEDNREYSTSQSIFNSTVRDRTSLLISDDTINAVSWYNGKMDRKKFILKYYSRTVLIRTDTILTPYRNKVEPWVFQVQMYAADTLKQTVCHQLDQPEINGKRTADSIVISLRTRKGQPVYYRIYQNNVLVKSGNADTLVFRAGDKSKHSWHLQYGIFRWGEMTYLMRSFHLKEKELQVKLETPKNVYPGQKVPVDVTVTDAYGKPVKNVNLTAWAVNTQMPGVVKPGLPYMGLAKSTKYLPYELRGLTDVWCRSSSELKAWQVGALKLRQNKVFGLMYPGGFVSMTDTSIDKTTEVDVFATHKGQAANILYVLANDTLVYTANVNETKQPWRMQPGKYKLTVRTWNRLIHLNNAEIKEGVKNFVGINVDSMILAGKADTISAGAFTAAEMEFLSKGWLSFTFGNGYFYDTLIVKVNGKLKEAYPYLQHLRKFSFSEKRFTPGNRPGNNSYYNNTWYYNFGPVNEGDRVEMLWKNGYMHEFVFKPGVFYSMTKTDLIRDKIESTAFSGLNFFQQFESDLHNFHLHWFNPYAKRQSPVYQGRTTQYTQPKEELPSYNYKDYYADYRKKTGYMHLFLKNDYRFVQRYWLFNLDDSSCSALYSQYSYGGSEIPGTGLYYLNPVSFYHTLNKEKNRYVLVLNQNDTNWLVKPLILDSASNYYIVLNPDQFRKLKESEYIWMDRMVKILGRAPMAVFRDTPTIDNSPYMVIKPHKKGRTVLEATIAGPAMKYVVDNAFVVLEKDGYFVRGAMTNEDGMFRMDSLQPGKYMLKVKGTQYHYWISYNLVLKAGQLHMARLVLKPLANFTWQGDRFMSVSESSEGAAVAYSVEEREVVRLNSKESYKLSTESRGTSALIRANASVVSAARGISVRGSRADGNGTYIEGIRNSNNENGRYSLGNRDKKGIYDDNFKQNDTTAMSELLDNLADDPMARKTRKFFRDYAYWIPTLNTDKKGRAGYTITYPDNITSWQTWVPAMDGKRHSGLGSLKVNAFKPLSYNLSVPRFLTEGDRLEFKTAILNYTGKNLTGKYYLKVNGIGKVKDTSFGTMNKEKVAAIAGRAGDSLIFEGGVELPNGYKDAEMRSFVVQSSAVIGGMSKTYKLDSASGKRMILANDSGLVELKVALYEHKIGLLNDYIEILSGRNYRNNHFYADYLLALLSARNIYASLGWGFDKETELKEAMRMLKSAQNKNGSFGWFGADKSENLHFTLYAGEILYRAHLSGFENNAWLNVGRYAEKKLDYEYGDELVALLKFLKTINRGVDFEGYLKKVKPTYLSKSGKLDVEILKIKSGKAPDLNVVLADLVSAGQEKAKIYGDVIWTYTMYKDPLALTFKANEILKYGGDTAGQEIKDARLAVSNYLSQPEWGSSNRYALACAVLADDKIAVKRKKPELRTVTVNGKPLGPAGIPMVRRVKPGDTLVLESKGQEIFVTESRTIRTYRPVSDSMSFRINRVLPAEVKEGQEFEMKVSVLNVRSSRGVVVEVPVPAGCLYASKVRDEISNESGRDYRHDRVLVYFEELPFGRYDFSIRLRAAYAGEFNMAPARAALEFYPEKAAYTQKQKLIIR